MVEVQAVAAAVSSGCTVSGGRLSRARVWLMSRTKTCWSEAGSAAAERERTPVVPVKVNVTRAAARTRHRIVESARLTFTG